MWKVLSVSLFVSAFFAFSSFQKVNAQAVCETTDYCCDVTNPSFCGYAIFNVVNGVQTGYLCQNPVPASCRTQVCDPAPYNCQVVPGGAVRAPTPIPTSIPTATVAPTPPGQVPKSAVPKPYRPQFEGLLKQTGFAMVVVLAIWMLLF